MSTPHISLRLPGSIGERVKKIAKAKGMKFSEALRFIVQRGLPLVEEETEKSVLPRRKVLSRGVV